MKLFSLKLHSHTPHARLLAVLAFVGLGATRGLGAQPVMPEAPQTPATAAAIKFDEAATQSSKRWSVSWGWNRSTYTNSDIHFWGDDHNFTLYDVEAHDLQTPVTVENVAGTFLNPFNMTLPQTNFRVAYQLDERNAVAFNLDHMKYRVRVDQTANISGQIQGTPQSGTQVLSKSFMEFEHTDGLNLFGPEYEHQWPEVFRAWGAPVKTFALAGVAIAMPKTNVTMNVLGRSNNDVFHVSGFSWGVGSGAEIDIAESYFLRGTVKWGFVNLPDVVTSSVGDKASHHFNYTEFIIAGGFKF